MKSPTAKPPTPEQIRTRQIADAERGFARESIKDNVPIRDADDFAARLQKHGLPLPVKATSTAVAVPDSRTPVQQYLDQIAPAAIVGRLIKFGKDGQFETADNGDKIGDDVDFIALCDQTLVGWIKFRGDGEPPDRVAGLLYDGFVLPPRETLGDDDSSQWELGLDKQPTDPWQHQICLVLQRADSGELYTFATTSKTGRRAIGNLLRHYDRMERARLNMYPVIRLKVGGFNHRDDRIGWVSVPVLAVVGRQPKESAARPDTSLQSDLNDEIPFS